MRNKKNKIISYEIISFTVCDETINTIQEKLSLIICEYGQRNILLSKKHIEKQGFMQLINEAVGIAR